MMNLQAIKAAVDQLSSEERAELHAYLDEYSESQPVLRVGTMDIDVLLEAAKAIRENFTDEEWDELEQAMNGEYIESVGEDGFPQ